MSIDLRSVMAEMSRRLRLRSIARRQKSLADLKDRLTEQSAFNALTVIAIDKEAAELREQTFDLKYGPIGRMFRDAFGYPTKEL